MLCGNKVRLCRRTMSCKAWNNYQCNQKWRSQRRRDHHKSATGRSKHCLLLHQPTIHLRHQYSNIDQKPLSTLGHFVWSISCFQFGGQWKWFLWTKTRTKRKGTVGPDFLTTERTCKTKTFKYYLTFAWTSYLATGTAPNAQSKSLVGIWTTRPNFAVSE